MEGMVKTGSYQLNGTLIDLDSGKAVTLEDEYNVVNDGVFSRIARRIVSQQTLERDAGESDEDFKARGRRAAQTVKTIVEPFEHEHRVRTAEVAKIAAPVA